MEGPVTFSIWLIVILAILGWCGTVPPPRPLPNPKPEPDPDPIYWPTRIIGAIGGVLVGWLVIRSAAGAAGPGLFTTMVGAFLGGRMLGDLAGSVMGRRG